MKYMDLSRKNSTGTGAAGARELPLLYFVVSWPTNCTYTTAQAGCIMPIARAINYYKGCPNADFQ
jgi:hypothetical protein